ncbi:hypothetical protein DYB34_003397 [Aphanomyces astaci]|uniref:VWFA domain-containing protein n=3 Tax=Aphanomyces astaci TaxID=112090 RepID=A0A397FHL3_APHAT|nr:hypothetical protein DYB34_003397 [Aphanomyces astaci]RHZ26798.1 hypothetical protein DYB31_009769 [Aphanomyces astaci]
MRLMVRLPVANETHRTHCDVLEELQQSLRHAGLESSNLVVAIDYTKSNEWSGERSFGGKCLHAIDPTGATVNPYQSVIHIMGRTLEVFDDDKLIPALGFGDSKTGSASCFSLSADGEPCHGFDEVLYRYAQVTPTLQLSGPTNFAPVIEEAIRIVERTRQYHILIIVADGQVSNEKETRDAIVAASNYPLSIVMVGVGDGPWDMMEEFDDQLPARRFDNFQFVEYNKVLRLNQRNPEVGFATAALMEIPGTSHSFFHK